MKAILNIYKDCTSEQPSKQYTCFRLLLGVSKKIESLQADMKDAKEDEQYKITIQILKAIFPNFDEADFDYIDPVEYLEFVKAISQEGNRIVKQAGKN